MPKRIINYIATLFQEIGYINHVDFFKSVFGVKASFFVFMQAFFTGFSVFIAFVEEWIWDPPLGAGIIFILIVGESITGAMVAHKKGNKFNIKKFYRSVPMLVSHIFILALAHNIGKVEPTLIWLPNAVFGWFAMRNFLAVLFDLVTLKLLRGEFVTFITGKLKVDNTRIAESIDHDLKHKTKNEN